MRRTSRGKRRRLLTMAKARARKHGLPFDLTIDDVIIPKRCPVLGIPLYFSVGKTTDNTPSIDRIVPKKGYVKGNVEVVSLKVNSLKRDMTPEFLVMLADYYRRYVQ